jgi:hypothetical protein
MPLKFNKEVSAQLFKYIKTIDLKFNRKRPRRVWPFYCGMPLSHVANYVLASLCTPTTTTTIHSPGQSHHVHSRTLTASPSQALFQGESSLGRAGGRPQSTSRTQCPVFLCRWYRGRLSLCRVVSCERHQLCRDQRSWELGSKLVTCTTHLMFSLPPPHLQLQRHTATL